jgi:UDP-N-acetylglucosamine 2-epimerase (non-hydrolysing)
MKIMTIYGTRPELIRLSRIIPKLDSLCEHTLVHTGQNFDYNLHEQFFKDLDLRLPNASINCNVGSFSQELASMLPEIEILLNAVKPDKILILGDTNSALCSIIARRFNIPVYHMEAGNRCFDMTVPEEANRHIIDAMSTINMPYTNLSKENLIKEGHAKNTIYVTGNPINEVLQYYDDKINNDVTRFGLIPKEYFLATFHRAENVDNEIKLNDIICSLERLVEVYNLPVICSVHPKTLDRITKFGITVSSSIFLCKPFGFLDFIALEKSAKCVISDSGTVPEECAILGVPSIIIRNVTERPELLQCGSTLLAGNAVYSTELAVKCATSSICDWDIPEEYKAENVSDIVCKILLGVV